MPEHMSILQLVGVATLAVSAAIWVAVLVRVLRRGVPVHRRHLTGTPRRRTRTRTLHSLPRQRHRASHAEDVELTSAERDAFLALVRQLSDDRSGDRSDDRS
ncbi:hypothetical protein [Streptomyces poonensis]|uniref:Uncharacterized protein n=1 Tax=Streptomyces poonensis TaxID=68255 RepID=A0A918PA06_9ACTN|nr:hypothetical protein [Streptomyces poonensis]GGY93932.1 hypothetical protein GCM10010365_10730 [Streptomyces poonensis]GLJ87487.1 hypothetical protein GCM10017589_00870 [Streptomyces poonensis]